MIERKLRVPPQELVALAIANTYYLPRYNDPKDKAKMDVYNKLAYSFPGLKTAVVPM
jgi:hypothetical protein